MKKVLIIAPYTYFPHESGFNRFIHIAEMLADNNYLVELVTSNFIHNEKKFREFKDFKKKTQHLKYKITLLEEIGYSTNVSLERIKSQKEFSNNLKNYLRNNYDYDLIYTAYPLISAAEIALQYSEKNKIPFILDIQDIWPESINTFLKLPIPLLNVLIFPLSIKANRIYKKAKNVIAVSDTYLDRALKVNMNVNYKKTIPIGTDLEYFDQHRSLSKKNIENEFWITYIGTISHSYDIETLIKAVMLLNKQGYDNIKLKICGNGPQEHKLKEVSKNNDSIEFLGNLKYESLIPILSMSDVAANALTKGSMGSLTNKLGDYLSAGLPILNSSLNKEVLNLIVQKNVGFNYSPGDYTELSKLILLLFNDDQLRETLAWNARNLAEEKFDRKITYPSIISLIKEVI